MTTKRALALLTNGSEEIELVATIDILRRAGVSNSNFSLTKQSIVPLPSHFRSI